MAEPHDYYVYMMQSSSRRALYIGVTGHLERRVWEHKNGRFEGFSADYKTQRLVWFERHAFIANAIAREKQLKGWRRAKKDWLVSLTNPGWKDLSEGWFEHHRYEPPAQLEQTQGPSTRPGGLARDDPSKQLPEAETQKNK